MSADSELKARHRKMWASGDYPSMVETYLLPLGPALVEACGITAGMRVLDVAAGTGNASIPAAKTGADVTASDLTPELFDAGRCRAKLEGVELAWVEADAENLPFEDQSYELVMSSIGAQFAAPPSGGRRRARPRLSSRRHYRFAELDARRHGRRPIQDDGTICPTTSARRATCSALGKRAAPEGALQGSRRLSHARAKDVGDHRVRASPRLRRAVQGAVRPNHRCPDERPQQRPRGGFH